MSVPTFLDRGAFADVYDLHDGSVVKAFRRVSHVAGEVVDWGDHDFLTRRVFEIECGAYERTHQRPDLSNYVPEFYGPVDEAVLGLTVANDGSSFVNKCAFRMEKIPGRAQKISGVAPGMRAAVSEVLTRISTVAGHVDVIDASCFVPGTRAEFTIIDFGLWKDLPDAGMLLDERKHLSADARRLLSIA